MAYNPSTDSIPSSAGPDMNTSADLLKTMPVLPPFLPVCKSDGTIISLEPSVMGAPIRKFDSGATRDQDTTKFDYEGFLSPRVLVRFAAYMHENRIQSDGSTRDSDNWQKGIPLDSYMKSLWRHLMAVWCHHRDVPEVPDEGYSSMEEALCGVIFNAQGYLHEIMKEAK